LNDFTKSWQTWAAKLETVSLSLGFHISIFTAGPALLSKLYSSR